MVVRSRLRETTGSGAGVEQGEAAGAIGRFHHAGREAGLPDGGGLLVAGDAADRDGPAEQLRRGRAEMRRRSPGPPAAWHRGTREERQELVVPVARCEYRSSSVREALVASVA